MSQYMRFIPENVAIKGARRIGIYNAQGNRVGQIPLGNLAMTSPSITGNLLYKVGLMSDVHINYQTAQSDLRVALAYLHNEENVLFSLIAGDLTGNGTAAQFSTVKSELSGYDVEFCIGNHDVRGGLVSSIEQHTGKPLYYTRSVGNDVYIFFGMCVEAEGSLFTTAMLDWLESTLEANKNKRCFVVIHVRPQDGCGNALGIYKYDIWGGAEATRFEGLMRTYKPILIHGHSHLKIYMQEFSDIANIDKIFGGWSIHIPSLAVPRDTSSVVNPSIVDVYSESEGYVMYVYENGIYLMGRDFVKGEFIPLGSYWLATTGTITT